MLGDGQQVGLVVCFGCLVWQLEVFHRESKA